MNMGDPAATRNRELIEELGCCSKGHYCTLKEILIRCPRDARMLAQIKCLEKFKYERSEREHRAIEWEEALDLWIAEGHAQRFAHHFRADRRVEEIYRAVTSEPGRGGPQ